MDMLSARTQDMVTVGKGLTAERDMDLLHSERVGLVLCTSLLPQLELFYDCL